MLSMLSMHSIRNQLGQRRSWLCGLLLCVLFRAVIPAGFMPGAAVAGSLQSLIVLCYGDSGSAELLSLAEAPPKHLPGISHHTGHHNDHHSGHHEKHPEEHQEHSDHADAKHSYCLFAGVGFNATGDTESLAVAAPIALSRHSVLPRNFSSAPPFQLQFSRAPPISAHLV
jgi:hypothetical protein